MTPNRAEVEGLVVRIQGEFLNTPARRLTLGEIVGRAGESAGNCDAILRALVEAGVLSVSAGGYERFFPRPSARTSGPHLFAA